MFVYKEWYCCTFHNDEIKKITGGKKVRKKKTKGEKLQDQTKFQWK